MNCSDRSKFGKLCKAVVLNTILDVSVVSQHEFIMYGLRYIYSVIAWFAIPKLNVDLQLHIKFFYITLYNYRNESGGSFLAGLANSFSPLCFTVRQLKEVMPTEQPCDLAYEFGDGLFDLQEYPEGFPRPGIYFLYIQCNVVLLKQFVRNLIVSW